VIELKEVGFRSAGGWALRDISLGVSAGEVFGLAGPNGGGKSLLLAICAALAAPHTGTVRIGAEDVRSSPAAVRRLIGYVPEVIGLHPRMTVREDLEFFAAAQGLSRQACRDTAAGALERWGLGMAASEAMGRVSRGILQRVGLARAWLHRPRVLLLDAPASGLDAEGREILRQEIRRHVEGGGSALVTSHERAELARWSHRIGFLVAGRLREVVESRDLRAVAPEEPAAVAMGGRELS
jgi:ABC-2 type transport system ATP-binding protein